MRSRPLVPCILVLLLALCWPAGAYTSDPQLPSWPTAPLALPGPGMSEDGALPPALTSTWVVERVDSVASGDDSSLALDGSGFPHISYNGGMTTSLRYAHKDALGWHLSAVASAVGYDTSMALDASNYPHISYIVGSGDLAYVYLNASGWHTETVETTDYSYDTSLALDSAGRPHISYARGYGIYYRILRYAYRDASGWHLSTVDSSQYAGEQSSLALDSAGYPHISYGGGGLKYAYLDATGWHFSMVDGDAYPGAGTSLALDGLGYPHIGYVDGADLDLRYAYQDASGWHLSTVDSSGDGEASPSLALDAAGRPHISYCQIVCIQGSCWCDDLKYAYQDAYGWYTATVDSAGDVGGGTSLALDSSGRPYISYYDNTNGDLKHAYLCTPLASVGIGGPLALLVGQSAVYRAAAQPITASLPITYTWDNGATGPAATYGWSTTGTYTLGVTGTSACGQGWGNLAVRVLEEWPYRFYLPLLRRSNGPR